MANFSTPPRIVSKAIAWNTTGIGTLVAVGALAAGEIVTKVWVEIATAWNSATSDTMTVGIADEDGSSPTALATYNAQIASAPVAGDVDVSSATASLGTGVGRAVTAAEVYVKVVSVGGSLSAGAATVYALVESPDAAGAAYVPGSTTPTQVVSSGESAGYVS
jgi:hypothetical protein